MIRSYYILTKPGIVRGNLYTALGGFFLGSRGSVELGTLLAMFFGTAFIISSACVFNNILDRRIDSIMKRTAKRPLVTGEIGVLNALVFGTALLIIGSGLLYFFANTLAFAVGMVGVIFYVLVYGYFKRATVHGTLIGSISGAIPPVIGYTAATGIIDLGAVLLFLILVAWQMPHFYAIGIFSKDDYRNASIPVLPVVGGHGKTKREMVWYAVLFVVSLCLLTVFGYTGFLYLVIMLLAGGVWLNTVLQDVADHNRWAIKVFKQSIVVLAVFSIVISIDFALPF